MKNTKSKTLKNTMATTILLFDRALVTLERLLGPFLGLEAPVGPVGHILSQ